MDSPATKRKFLRIFDDYFEFGETRITKEEFECLFKQYSNTDLGVYFGMCSSSIKKILKIWNMHKTSDEVSKLNKKTN